MNNPPTTLRSSKTFSSGNRGRSNKNRTPKTYQNSHQSLGSVKLIGNIQTSLQSGKPVQTSDFIPFPSKKLQKPYSLFFQSQNTKIREQYPEMKTPEIVKLAAERYKHMSQQQRRPYVEQYEKIKRIFFSQGQQRGKMTVKRYKRKANRFNYALQI